MKNILFKLAGVLALCASVLAPAAQAQTNAIREIRPQMDGDRMLIKVDFEQPLVAAPNGWRTVEPARIVFDFPSTTNKSGKGNFTVNNGGLRTIHLVQTDAQTRMVFNMTGSTGYKTEISGNSLLITLDPFQQTNLPQDIPAVAGTKPVQRLIEPNTVRDIVFRRGEQGQANVIIDLTDSTVPVDIRRVSAGIVVDLSNTQVPEALRSKRDVIDFATPATYVSAQNRGDQARIEIGAKGAWQHTAQLVNNQLFIEVKQLTTTEMNKLVPLGQEGKKISINFYDADVSMVLRTLAELSGRNVIIDPSLQGRKITITLDNMPYDQALELVMAQTGAGMRVRENVVLFGSRDVLMKRDADLADELSRANETAPLVTESFQLNYIKASEMITLLMLAQSDTSSTAPSPTNVTTATPGGAPTTTTANLPRGVLSNRGSISAHDSTNKLFIRDTQAVIDLVRNMIREVDQPAKQVLIEARIVEVATDFTKALGVRLNFFDRNSYGVGRDNRIALGKPTTSFSNVDLFGTPGTPALSKDATAGLGTTYALSGTSVMNLMLFNKDATRVLTMELQAAETDLRSKTISTPRVVTENRKNAKISNVQQTTVVTGINTQTGVPIYTTYSAPLTLDVRPSITPDNRVSLDLKITKSTLEVGALGANNLDTNTLNTNVIVENGGTVVIGGFYRETDSENNERVPFLGDLPYVGWLFKANTKLRTKSELLVFVTPRVIDNALALR